jgi:hypothetical protein
VADLPKGSLIVTDLGFFAFAWFDDLTKMGYWWVSRLRQQTSYQVRHVFYQDGDTVDALIWLGAYRADRAKHVVRLVQFRVGQRLYRYITNVLDPHCFPLRAVAEVYARRWDFELAVKLVKRELGLHLLWAAKAVVIQQQVWAVLIIAQVLHALQLEIAAKANADPFEVSLPLLVEYLPHLAASGQDPIQVVVEEGRRVGFIRPSRRTVIQAPDIPAAAIVPVPADLVLERTPRHAQRKCAPRGPTPKRGAA